MFAARPEQQAQDQRSDPRRTSTASARSQCSPPDPNSKHRIRGVIPTGPQLQALDRSVRRQTRTASTGSDCSPPDLNCKRWIAVISAGPPPQAQDQIDPRRTSRLFPAGLEQQAQAQDQGDPRRTSTASARSQCSPPDPNSKHRIRGVIPAGPQLQALAGSQCSPPDLHRNFRIRAFPAGPPPRAPQSSPRDLDHKEHPIYQPERMSEDIPDTYARKNVKILPE